ncbi:MAG TPA: hypothetical protein VF691_02980 [Cytophagaceae bacterium]
MSIRVAIKRRWNSVPLPVTTGLKYGLMKFLSKAEIHSRESLPSFLALDKPPGGH